MNYKKFLETINIGDKIIHSSGEEGIVSSFYSEDEKYNHSSSLKVFASKSLDFIVHNIKDYIKYEDPNYAGSRYGVCLKGVPSKYYHFGDIKKLN